MKSYANTDIGVVRSINQDFVYACDEKIGNLNNLYIVADGMGGHNAGDLASRYAVVRTIEYIKENTNKNPIAIMDEVIKKVNKDVYEKSMEDESYSGMGTTMVIATVLDNQLYVANVGDSRLYIVNDKITQITRDHSWVEEMVSRGELDRDDPKFLSKKNVITRAIGGDDEVMADFFEVAFNENDKILICSDGLTNMVNDEQIREIIEGESVLENATFKLIEIAKEHGGKDNIAVVVAER